MSRKFLMLLFAFGLVTVTAGCGEEWTKQVAFGTGIYTWYSNSLVDRGKVDNVIAGYDIPADPIIYTGKADSEAKAEADALSKARPDIDRWVAMFKAKDFESLDLDPGTKFVWGVKDTNGNLVGKFEWNME